MNGVVVFAVLFCLALAGTRQDLEDLKGRIYDASTSRITLSASTLSNSYGFTMMQRLAQSSNMEFIKADCSIQADNEPYYLLCHGTGEVLKAEANWAVIFTYAGEKLDFGFEADVKRSWNPAEALADVLPFSSLPKKLNYDTTVGASIKLSSVTISAGSYSFQKGIFATVDGVVAKSESLYGLEKLNAQIRNVAFNVDLAMPYGDVAFDWTSARGRLNFNIGIDTGVGKGVVMEKLVASVRGFTITPDIDVQVTSKIQLAKMDSPLAIVLSGKWTSTASRLELVGRLAEPWVHPFGVEWLTLKNGEVKAVLSIASSAVLESLEIASGSTIVTKSYTIDASAQVRVASNYQDWNLELSVDASRKSVAGLALAVAGLTDSYTSLNEMIVNSASGSITVRSQGDASLKFAINIDKSTEMGNLLAPVSPQASAFDFNLEINIASQKLRTLDQISVVLSSTRIVVRDNINFQNIRIQCTAAPAKLLNIAFTGDLSVQFNKSPSETIFTTSADWSAASSVVNYRGGLKSTWDMPFNLKWLNIKKAMLTLAVAVKPAALNSLKVEMDVMMKFKSEIEASVVLMARDNFKDVSFSIDFRVESQTVGDVFNTISGSYRSSADSLAFKSTDVTIVVSTFDHDDVQAGVTVNAAVRCMDNSELARVVAALGMASGSVSNVDFQLRVFVPVFSVPITGIKIKLHTSEIPIKPTVKFTGVDLDVSIASPITVQMESGVAVKFRSQPDWIQFLGGGGFSSAGQITIQAGIYGTIAHMFGFKDMDLTNPWIKLGFIATPPYLSAFGSGGMLKIGDYESEAVGYVDITNPTDIFFKYHVKNIHFKSFIDMANHWHPGQKFDISKVPDTLLVEYADFEFAPADGSISVDGQTIFFKKGVKVDGKVDIMQATNVTMSIETTETDGEPDILIAFDTVFKNPSEAYKNKMHAVVRDNEFQPPEIHEAALGMGNFDTDAYAMNVSQIIPVVKQITIDKFSVLELSRGKMPHVTIVLVFNGKDYVIENTFTFEQLATKFIELVEQMIINLKKYLTVECVVNADCGSGRKCVHNKGNWHCADKCDENSGEISVLGCVNCLTEAECQVAAHGRCCMRGECKASPSKYCGMCYIWLKPENKCNSPESGCLFGFCRQCITSLDCLWKGSAGSHCRDRKCQ